MIHYIAQYPHIQVYMDEMCELVRCLGDHGAQSSSCADARVYTR